MKKLISLFLTFVLLSNVQSVSVSWSGNTSNSKLIGLTGSQLLTTGTSSETSSIKVYFLLVSDITVLQSATFDHDDINSYAKGYANGLDNSAASATGRFGGTVLPISGSSAGISYFARVYATIGGDDYYMDLKDYSVAGGQYWTTALSGNDGVTETFTWYGNSTTPMEYGGSIGTAGDFNKWIKVPVPEPATGAMALAGLALLFRRKRK